MKEPAVVSPFAAKTRQEQQEQWIWWQCQRDATTPVDCPEISPSPEAERVPAMTFPSAVPGPPSAPTSVPMQRQRIHHSQYDAVMKRIRSATQQTGHYTSCASSPERQTQPSSGSENADA